MWKWLRAGQQEWTEGLNCFGVAICFALAALTGISGGLYIWLT